DTLPGDMNRTTLRLASLLGASALAACSPPVSWDAGVDAPPDIAADVAPDAQPDVMDAAPDATDTTDVQPDIAYDVQFADTTRDVASDVVIAPTHEYVYVLNAISVDPDDSPARPHTGFDIDGRQSTTSDVVGCLKADFASALDPDQNAPSGCVFGTPGCNGGVDNQFPTMATTILSVTGMDARVGLTTAVNHSQLVFMLRLTRVDSFADDADVGVQIYTGFPTFSTGCTSVLPGRTYQVDSRSITAGGSTLDNALFSATAQIVAGRLRFTGSDTSVFTLSGTGLLPIALHAMRLRGDVTPTGIANGNLGGWDTGDDLVAQLTTIAPTYAALLPSVIGGFVDYQMMGICIDRTVHPWHLGGVSLGTGFSAVPAVIDPVTPIAAAQRVGTCGI
ncbi:MAG: hypothetical protein WCJ30_20830, partial [Deltaproteobacteria bacterium]